MIEPQSHSRVFRRLPSMGVLLLLGACGGSDDPVAADPGDPAGGLGLICELDPDILVSGGPGPDGIPALTLPEMVHPSQTGADYLRDSDRVLGVVVDSDARAYPHPILWWHEIVNDRFVDGSMVTVSFCPLTGSGLAWNSSVAGEVVEFGVSGLLFANNLVMFDRESGELYGPQMSVTGRCEGFNGETPQLIPVREMSWGEWKELYPHTTVLSSETGFDLPYGVYPYGSYDQLHDETLLFEMDVDRDRPIKERVLGIRLGSTAGKAYPFGELRVQGSPSVVHDAVAPIGSYVVFYDDQSGAAAAAYRASLDGMELTFKATQGSIRDEQTGSRWNVGGEAVEGLLAGERLEAVAEAYVSFWFAWRHFQPDADVFNGSG